MKMLRFTEDCVVEAQQDHGHAVFVARLSDGSVVYQDDWLDKVQEPTLIRLATYLRASDLRLVGLSIKFQTEWFCPLPDNAPAYYFAKGIGAMMGGPVQSFVVLGSGWPETRVYQCSTPDLMLMYSEMRLVDENDPRIIRAGWSC